MIRNLRDLIGRHRTTVKWILAFILIYFGIPKCFRFLTAERVYYPNGQIKMYRERLIFDLNFGGGGRRTHGLMKEYYEDGRLASRQYAYQGLPDGTASAWSPKGLRTDHWTFDHGRPRDGQRTILYDEGNTKQIISYKDGVLDGRQASWNKEGLLLDEWHYSNGKPKDGKRIILYDSGKPKSERNYQDGIEEGWQKTWSEDGHPRGEQFLAKGKATIVVSYDQLGVIVQKTEYLRTGKVITNYANGKAIEKIHFEPR